MKQISDRGRIIKRLDALFRQILLAERPHRCEWCGKPCDRLQVAHILPKGSHPRLRYRRENILLLDYPCHPEKWHRNPYLAMEFIEMTKGNKYVEGLKKIENLIGRHDKLYLLALEEGMKKELEALCLKK